MVNAHPSTAMSWVAARKLQQKNMRVSNLIWGSIFPASSPTQISTLNDIINIKIPANKIKEHSVITKM